MSTIERSKKRIGKVVLGLSFYALLTVPCASQTSDNLSVPRASLERLESAIQGVAEAMRTITSAQKPTPTQNTEPSSQPPPAATDHFAQDPNPHVTTSEGCVKRDCSDRPPDRDCCERPRDQDCCERSRDRDCCEPHRDQDCCERSRDRDCCEPHRHQGCCEPHHHQGCCEPHRYRGCCEPHRNRNCCETGRREPLVWRAPPCDYCGRWGLYDEY